LYRRIYDRYAGVVGYKDLKFLTLTWKPVRKQKAEIVRDIGKCFKKLLHRHPYNTVWSGVFATIECKKTKSGWFYYHLHALCRGGYVSQERISRDWFEISGFPIVYVKRIWRTPKRALRYVLKYVLKGFSFNKTKDIMDFKESMRGVRYIRSYGDFYDAEYHAAAHVYFPCPRCGAVRCWVILEFVSTVDILLGEPYGGSGRLGL